MNELMCSETFLAAAKSGDPSSPTEECIDSHQAS